MRSDRSAQLSGVKLSGLVREHLDDVGVPAIGDPEPFGTGATLIVDDSGWVYVPDAPSGTLGAAVGWAARRGVQQLGLIVDERQPLTAFCAEGYLEPQPHVWAVNGRALRRVDGVRPDIPEPPSCDEFVAILEDLDLEVVADHGVWIGEINGLEVARVGERDGACVFDIGVGAHDQFAAATLAAGNDRARLRDVVAKVSGHRRPQSATHPLGRLVRSRWLRAQAVADPAQIEFDEVEPIPLLSPRGGLNEIEPAAAIGRVAGETAIVVFSVGIDLAVSETAAGLSRLHRPDRVVVVTPGRDRHPRLVEAIGRVAPRASVVALEGEWGH